jgi:serine/threonine protein kinase
MLITSDKVLNLSDFGVAEQFNPYCNTSLKTSTFAGTHQFLSPELTSAKDVFDGEKGEIIFSRYRSAELTVC